MTKRVDCAVAWLYVKKYMISFLKPRYMYWTSHGRVVSINKAGMDGSKRERIISNGLFNPTDLTLDKPENTLYWVDGGNKVNYVSLKTRKRSVCKLTLNWN